MKTLIVATDFSATAENAAVYAMGLAHTIHAKVLLLNVYQLPVNYVDIAMPFTIDDWEEQTERAMTELKNKLLKITGKTVEVTTEVRMGGFLTELRMVCQQEQPYAVVMGCNGSSVAERFFYGSHAINAMKNLEWPVITIPPGLSFHEVKKIGLACDLEETIMTVPADDISRFVMDFNAALYILYTSKEQVYNPEVVFASGQLGEKLEKCRPEFRFIAGDTDQSLIDFAGKENIDLLIVLPGKYRLLDAIVHKSHTRKLVLRSHIPVMAFHHHTQHVKTSQQA